MDAHEAIACKVMDGQSQSNHKPITAGLSIHVRLRETEINTTLSRIFILIKFGNLKGQITNLSTTMLVALILDLEADIIGESPVQRHWIYKRLNG
jgi:hypothetical protein